MSKSILFLTSMTTHCFIGVKRVYDRNMIVGTFDIFLLKKRRLCFEYDLVSVFLVGDYKNLQTVLKNRLCVFVFVWTQEYYVTWKYKFIAIKFYFWNDRGTVFDLLNQVLVFCLGSVEARFLMNNKIFRSTKSIRRM